MSAFLAWVIAAALALLPAAMRPFVADVPVYEAAPTALPADWCGATSFLVWPDRIEPIEILLPLAPGGCPDPVGALAHEYRHVLGARLYRDISEACRERLEREEPCRD